MRLPMVPRDIGDQIQLECIERTRSRALDEIVGMLVVLLISNKQPDVVKHRRSPHTLNLEQRHPEHFGEPPRIRLDASQMVFGSLID